MRNGKYHENSTSLEESGLLIQGTRKPTKNEAK